MLSFLPFISNEILAQDVGYDAYFRYESNPEQRVPYYPEGFAEENQHLLYAFRALPIES